MATDYSSLEQQLKSKLSASPTAYGSGSTPTSEDIKINRELTSVQTAKTKAEDQAVQDKWYADEQAALKKNPKSATNTALKNPPKGAVNRLLNTLALPGRAISGAAKYATGSGTKKGLWDNITTNINEGGGFGDIIRHYGGNDVTSMLGGFALDVALDPVNWLTMGTEAFVPRLFTGATKGGSAGFKLAAKSVGLDMAKTATKPIDWALRTKEAVGAEENVTKAAQALLDFRSDLKTSSRTTKELYDALTGNRVEDVLARGFFGNHVKEYVSEAYNKNIPEPVKLWVDKYFGGGGSQGWVAKKIEEAKSKASEISGTDLYNEKMKLRQMIVNDQGQLRGVDRHAAEEAKKLILNDIPNAAGRESILDPAEKLLKQINASKEGPAANALNRVQDATAEAVDAATTGAFGARTFGASKMDSALSDEWVDDLVLKYRAKQMKDLGIDETEMRALLGQVKEAARSRTGLDALDNGIDNFRKATYFGGKVSGDKMIRVWDTYLSMFKTGAIANPATIIRSFFGNLGMTGMSGLDVADPKYVKELMTAVGAALKSISRDGKTVDFVKLMSHPEMKLVAEEFPELFRATYKVDPRYILSSSGEFQTNFLKYMDDLGISGGASKSELESIRKSFLNDLEQAKIFSGVNQLDSTFVHQELNSDDYFTAALKWARSPQNKNRPAAKFLEWTYNKPLEVFEAVDQSFKLGTAAHLVKNGISEDRLKVFSRLFNGGLKIGSLGSDGIIHNGDIAKDLTTGMWKFTGIKALDAANEVYMNYAALPAAVKVMRRLPLIGMPFASFAYMMMVKTGKTALYNPSFFNKVQFMLGELNGGRTPLEKKALNSPYYSYLKNEGMESLPFFRENPVYMNFTPFFPHLTMNIFTPSERKTPDSLGGSAVRFLDSSPFLKDPAGQMLSDWLLVPLLLKESSPTGIFDQPLYPNKATTLQKAGYFGRSFAETIAPPILAGVVAPLTPDAAVEALPYKYRKIGNAMQGKTSDGATTNESRTNNLLRALLNVYGGIGLYPVNIKYTK